jgi:hypothetical protein
MRLDKLYNHNYNINIPLFIQTNVFNWPIVRVDYKWYRLLKTLQWRAIELQLDRRYRWCKVLAKWICFTRLTGRGGKHACEILWTCLKIVHWVVDRCTGTTYCSTAMSDHWCWVLKYILRILLQYVACKRDKFTLVFGVSRWNGTGNSYN